jgi:hypothetical protein
LVTRKVIGQIAAQPLYVKGVTINHTRTDPVGGVTINRPTLTNVVYVVTRKNMIYAFDADNLDPSDPSDPNKGLVWTNPIELLDSDRRDPPASTGAPLRASPLAGMNGQNKCNQIHGSVGIQSTPVIDPQSQVMYVVARFALKPHDPFYGTTAYFYLVKLDIRTGQELQRVRIDSPRGLVGPPFNASAELNRAGLLLLNDVLYIAFAAPVCDAPESRAREFGVPDSHGWVFAYRASTLRLLDAYNTSPQNALAGIWQSGAGLAANPATNSVYAFTGNNANPDGIAINETGTREKGDYDDKYHRSRTDLGESLLKFDLGADGKFICEHMACPIGAKCDDPSTQGVYCVTAHFTAGNWFRLDRARRCPGSERRCVPRDDGTVECDKCNGASDCDLCPADVGHFLRKAQCEKKFGQGAQTCSLGGDSDLGSGGPVVLSNGIVLGGGKQGRLYVIDPMDLHNPRQGFLAAKNTFHLGVGPSTCLTNNPADEPGCIIQSDANDDYDLGQAWGPNIHGSPAVLEPPSPQLSYLYLMAEKDFLRAYRIDSNGHVHEQPDYTTEKLKAPWPPTFAGAFQKRYYVAPCAPPTELRSPDGMPGAAISVSSNRGADAVVWVSVSPCDATITVEPGIIMAFDTSLNLLWSDPDPGIYMAKFVPLTIAGGKVFRATFGYHDTSCRADPDTQECGALVVYGIPKLSRAAAPAR